MKKFIFIHIPKTGGVSIKEGLKIREHTGNPLHIEHYHETGHRSAIHARNALGKNLWKDCFTFSFIRNPWDRMVSWYHFYVQMDVTNLPAMRQVVKFMRTFKSFEHWVRSGLPIKWPKNLVEYSLFPGKPPLHLHAYILTREHAPLVNFIGRFEHLQSDFNKVCRKIGIKSTKLPHIKKSKRPRNYRKLYNNNTKEIVARIFAKDIELFKYTF